MTLDLEKESGVAGTRTHGRGSVPLMSKSDAIPLCHETKTYVVGKTTKYIVTAELYRLQYVLI